MNKMKFNNKDVWVNFRLDKTLRDEIDLRANKKGVSRSVMARQFFEMGANFPEDVPQRFTLLLYEQTKNMRTARTVRNTAIDIITEMLE